MSIIEIMPRHFWYQKWRLFKQLAMKVASWHLEVAWILLCSSMLPHLVDQSLCFANPAGTLRPSIIQAQKASRLCSSYEDQWLWQLKATPMQHLKHVSILILLQTVPRFFCFLLWVPLIPVICPSILTTCCPQKSPVLSLLIELTSFVCRFQCLP